MGTISRAGCRLGMDENTQELNVVPFLDILMNVMMFVLATITVTFTSTADVSPPAAKPGGGATGLTVLIVDDGFAIKNQAGQVASIQKDDYDALAKTVASLDDDKTITLTASSAIRYERVIATMDALRPSHPDVLLAVAR